MTEESKYLLSPLSDKPEIAVVYLKPKVLGGNDALEFTSALQPAKELGLRTVVADLSYVDIINSSGLGMLVSGMSTCRKSNISFVLTGIPEKVNHLLVVTHLDKVFKIYQDIEAVKADN